MPRLILKLSGSTSLGVMTSLVLLTGCGLPPDLGLPALDVVEDIEIERYMGRWYEIARYPNSFEQDCVGVTADYTLLSDGRVEVLNTCRDADGNTVSTIECFAEVADPETRAKLTVYFFFPFGAPYWILELGDDYEYAVVGDPSRTFLWILSRTPTLDPALYDEIVQRLPDKGYDPGRLELVPQDAAVME